MIGREWYKARIRWAEMVEGYGIRNWEEGLYLYRSENRETAFQQALEIGEGGQSGGEEENRRRTRWVETRLAEVVALDCLGPELRAEEETAGGALDSAASDREDRFRTPV